MNTQAVGQDEFLSLDEDEIFFRPLSEAKRQFEKIYLCHLLTTTSGNISEMARLSGRYRGDIYRLLEKHGLNCDEFRRRSNSMLHVARIL